MTEGIKRILFNQGYEFAIEIGKTEEEAQAAGKENIARCERLAEEEKNTKWVDITTGKRVANPY